MQINAKTIFRRLLYIAFGINLLMLLLSLCASWMNPKYFWPPAFIKLFFGIWFIFHLGFIGIFIYLKKKIYLAISLASVLLCFPALSKTIAFHPFYKGETKGQKLRIMSYNVMGFAWYTKKRDAFAILKNIREQKPDIVCMQEYLARNDDKFKIMDTLVNLYGYKYYKEHIIVHGGHGYYFGSAVFSKYPLLNFTSIPFDNSLTNGGCHADIVVKGDTLRLINVHFQSFSMEPREYEWMDKKDRGSLSRYTLTKIALYKMRRAFRKKSFQTEEVKKVIKQSPYPVILCGDFNDTPLSYTYSELTDLLRDTYLDTNTGLGSTFGGKLPFLRIDYIMADKRLTPERNFIVKKFASDHYPVICDFRLK